MPGETDDEYHARRSQQELDLAASAIDPEVKALHLSMAARYAALLETGGARPARPATPA